MVLGLSGLIRAHAQPTIISQPQDQVLSRGATATFTVVASNALTYQWRFEGTNIVAATFPTLEIANVNTNHAGYYTVVVSNSGGSVTSAPVRLTVIPVFPGTLDLSFNAGTIYEIVRSVAAVADDKVLIAGWFNSINGITRNRIARLNPDGSIDPSFDPGPGPNDNVYAMAVQPDGRIVIGGEFFTVNTTNRQRIARLNSDGTLDMTFQPPSGANGTVWAVALQSDGKILIGGEFTTVNGAERQRIARLNSDGSLDNTFSAQSVTDSVRSIAVQTNGQILMAGNFVSVNGISRRGVARLNSDGNVDASFSPGTGANDWVFAVIPDADGKVLIGGNFSAVDGTNRVGIARLNNSGSIDSSFDPGTGAVGGVAAIALQPDGKILIGGSFFQYNGHARNRLARLNSNGSLDESFVAEAGVDNWIESIALHNDGRILIGGYFTRANNTPRFCVARLIGGDPAAFAPLIATQPLSQTVSEGADVTLALQAYGFPLPSYQWQRNSTNVPGATNTSLLFQNVWLASAGAYRVVVSNSLGSVTSAVATLTIEPAPTNPGAPDISFYPGAGPDDTVNAVLVQSDGKVIIGGIFRTVAGMPRVGIARLNQDGSLDPVFNPILPEYNYITALTFQNNQVLMGGGFYSVNGVPRNNIARLSGAGSLDLSFNPIFSGPVSALAVQTNQQILVAGYFSSLYQYPRIGIARVNNDGSADTNFNAGLEFYAPRALAIQSDGKILLGGDFTSLSGSLRSHLARLNSNGSLDSSFNLGSGPNSTVTALAVQPDGRLLLAGVFTKVNGIARNRIARLNPDGSLDPSFDPAWGPNDNVDAMALQPDGKIVIGGEFTAVNGIANSFVARLNPDGSVDSTFDSGLGPNDEVRAVTFAPENKIVIGGDFTKVNGTSRRHVARLFGGDLAPFRPIIHVQPASQTVAAGEDVAFTVVAGGVPHPTYQWQFNGTNLAAANTWILNLRNVRSVNDGFYSVVISNVLGSVISSPAYLTVVPPPRNPGAPDIGFYSGLGPNDRVNAIAVQSDQKIVVGGNFTEVDGQRRSRIARLNRNGSLDASFDPGPGANGQVNAIALLNDGRLFIAGSFTSVNGTNRFGIARLNSDGGLDPGFNPAIGGFLQVHALAVQSNGQVVIGGAFNFGSVGDGLLRLNADGSRDLTFRAATEPYTYIYALELQPDGKILIGGQFTSVGGVARTYVARLNADGSLDATFNPTSGASSLVYSLQQQADAKVLLGGDFEYVNAFPRRRIARLNPDGSLDDSFHPGGGANRTVYPITVQTNGKVLLGGLFDTVGFTPRSRIARLNRNGSVDLNFDPGSGATGGTSFVDEYGELVDLTVVASIALQNDGRILIGGDFTQVNGVTRRYIARLFDREASAFLSVRTVPATDGVRIELAWETGALQVADELDGPWQDVVSAETPFLFAPGSSQKFFRLKFN